MKTLLRMVLALLGTAVAVAAGVCCALIFVIDFKQGGNSPGILAIFRSGLRYWIPLVFTLIALWAVGTCTRTILLAQRRASAAGISTLQYFDLTHEQKSQLSQSDQEVG